MNEKRVRNHIRNFEKALGSFNNDEPLSRFLTRFFKENKQMGSSDRKMTSRFCYNLFRLGNLFNNEELLERLAIAEFLCEEASDLVALLKLEWHSYMDASISEKLNLLQKDYSFDINDLFPCVDRLSLTIDNNEFLKSHFCQPKLFIRVKRGFETNVKAKLEAEGIEVVSIGNQTLALENGTKLQNLSSLKGLYEVQDLSSQRTIDFMDMSSNAVVWDACAASGGKSLMLLDKYPKINLLVSDVRLSILRNLDQRFEDAKIKSNYKKKVIDLTQSLDGIINSSDFNVVILDVPCSGSGTWGRTPEMMSQFNNYKLNEFSTLQTTIASNVVKGLKTGQIVVYMTCSVYKDENEDVVNHIAKEHNLTIENMQVIKGYDEFADTMFAARLVKQ